MSEEEKEVNEQNNEDGAIFDELTVLQEGLEGDDGDQDGPSEHSVETDSGVDSDPSVFSSIQMGSRDSETGAATNLVNARVAEASEDEHFGFGQDEGGDEEIDSLDHRDHRASELGDREPGDVGGQFGQKAASDDDQAKNNDEEDAASQDQGDVDVLGGEQVTTSAAEGGAGEDALETATGAAPAPSSSETAAPEDEEEVIEEEATEDTETDEEETDESNDSPAVELDDNAEEEYLAGQREEEPVHVNTGPVAEDSTALATEDIAFSGAVTATDADGDQLTYSLNQGPENGTLTFNDDGTYTYTPDANYNGSDSFSYQVSDGQGGTTTATVNLTVDPTNDSPVSASSSGRTTEDTAYNSSVSGSDVDGDSLTYALASGPTNGTLTFNADGTYSYTPDEGYNGSDSFTYQVSDGQGGTTTASVNLTVTPENDDPVTSNSTATATEDTAYNGSVTATDADGDSLTFSLDSAPSNGSLIFNADGTYTYTPNSDYNGADSFSYQVSDGQGGISTATVNLTVNPANDDPVSADSAATTNEDASYSGSVSATDVDGDNLTYALDSGPSNGTLTFNADGTYTYTPDTNYNGSDSFSYQVSDGQGGTTTATVNLTVDAANDNPVTANSSASATEDTAYNGSVSATDVDGDSVTFALDSAPSNGTISFNSDGTYTYTPDADYNGTDSFSYQVSDGKGGSSTATVNLTINPENDDPVSADSIAGTQEDTTLTGSVSGSDVDGDTLTYALDTGPSNGTISFNADGTYTYTPDADYNGSDSFTYQVSDGQGGSTTATVNLTIASVHDNSGPISADSSATATEDTAYSGSVTAIDIDGDTLTYSLDSGPSNGSLTFNADGTYTYTPNGDYNGSDSFTYQVSDGQGGTTTATVNLTINPENDDPVTADTSATTNEDAAYSGTVSGSDVDGDSLTYTLDSGPSNGTISFNADGSYTYTPDTDYNGSDSFTYQVSDGKGGTDTATVNLTVDPTNDNPVSADSSVTATEDTAYNGSVSASDVDGDSLTYALDSGPSNGTLTFNADGSYTYTPDGDYNGTDSFTYQVSDGQGGTTTATVNLTVDPTNDNPVSADSSATATEDTAYNGSVSASDVDGDSLTYSLDSAPSNGTLTFNADGTYTYTPDGDYNGTDSFIYQVSDGQGGTTTATVNLTVDPTNDNPVSADSSATTDENTAYTGSATATDVDGDNLTYSLDSGPSNGSLTFNADGSYTYTPDTDYDGDDSFTYQVSDGQGGTTSATVNLTVNDTGANNGFGNGDQNAPGNSGNNNNAENGNGNGNGNNKESDSTDNDNDDLGANKKDDLQGSDDTNDTLYGGANADQLDGKDGDDTLYGGSGDDDIKGDKGDDTIYAGSDDDKVDSGEGDDTVYGGSGDDDLKTDKGNDIVDGGSGDDTIYGGEGNDTITGGAGDDYLYGDAGDDLFIWDIRDGNDHVQGGSGWDTIALGDNNNQGTSDAGWTVTLEDGSHFTIDPSDDGSAYMDIANDSSGTIVDMETGESISFEGIERIEF